MSRAAETHRFRDVAAGIALASLWFGVVDLLAVMVAGDRNAWPQYMAVGLSAAVVAAAIVFLVASPLLAWILTRVFRADFLCCLSALFYMAVSSRVLLQLSGGFPPETAAVRYSDPIRAAIAVAILTLCLIPIGLVVYRFQRYAAHHPLWRSLASAWHLSGPAVLTGIARAVRIEARSCFSRTSGSGFVHAIPRAGWPAGWRSGYTRCSLAR